MLGKPYGIRLFANKNEIKIVEKKKFFSCFSENFFHEETSA